MSRASDVRDAVAAQIEASSITTPVDVVVFPDYEAEDVVEPRIAVMNSTRTVEVDQGPDRRDVVLGIGVVGSIKQLEGYSVEKASRRKQQVDRADEYDAIFESVVELWSPNGPLTDYDVAEHRFVGIEQPTGVDFTYYRDKGVWVCVLFVTYRDTKDD